MKGKDIIEYIVRGEIPDMEQNMEQVRTNCLNEEANENSIKSKFRLILGKPAAAVMLMMCFIMLASAAAVIIYQTQYIPGKGFVEGDYEIYYTPEILKFDNLATVETVTRVKNGKSSELSIIITDMLDKNIKIITEKHGEFELIPAVDYNYSSFGTMGAYQFNDEGAYSSYGYFIKDFPDINEFTLVNNGESTEVKLVKSNSNGVLTAEDSGVTMKFYNMSKGSKVLAYEMEENNFDIRKILKNSGAQIAVEKDVGFFDFFDWVNEFEIYDESGNRVYLNGCHSGRGPDGLSTTMFLRIGREERISRMAINSLTVTLKIYALDMDNKNNIIISNPIGDFIDIPVPADGEKIIFDDGFMLYDYYGFISELMSVTRKGKEVSIYTNTEYTGDAIENMENLGNIYTCFSGGLRLRVSGPGYAVYEINGDEDFVKIRPDYISYKVNGSWEINFD